jgi:alpha-tubulin suppressor-like RCC1 family protein
MFGCWSMSKATTRARPSRSGWGIAVATACTVVAGGRHALGGDCDPTISIFSTVLPAAGGTFELAIDVEEKCDWHFFIDWQDGQYGWLSADFDDSGGYGPGSLIVTAMPNESGVERMAGLVLSGSAGDRPMHLVVQTSDATGVVECWGSDQSGQASPPSDLGLVRKVAAGAGISVALTADGTVRRWGQSSTVPAGLSNVTDITWALARTADGDVVPLGGGSVPEAAHDVVAISSGPFHHVALRRDGKVVCWGNNQLGQCNVPPDLPPVVRVAAGYGHTTVISATGELIAWGDRLAIGTSPTLFGTIRPIEIAAGWRTTSVLFRTGAIRFWSSSGLSTHPSLVVPPIARRPSMWHSSCIAVNGIVHGVGPQSAGPGEGIPVIDAAIGADHGVAIVGEAGCRVLPHPHPSRWIGDEGGVVEFEVRSSGATCEWIATTSSEWVTVLEQPTPGVLSTCRVQIEPNETGTLRRAWIDVGGRPHTVVQRDLGPERLVVLGGFGGPSGEDPPSFDHPVVDVAAGSSHHLALLADGSVRGWGSDYNGQSTPPADLGPVVAIAAGQSHSVALLESGEVVCWGWNGTGQCDVPVDLGTTVVIAAGYNTTFAISSDGRVRCWGQEDLAGVPDDVAGVVDLAAGVGHAVALLADGTVRCWGFDNHGQCDVPVGLVDVVEVAAGARHSLARRADGSVVCWGYTVDGECEGLADLEAFDVSTIAAGGDISSMSFSGYSVLRGQDGRLHGQGDGFYGQIAIPETLGRVDRYETWGRVTLVLRSDCDEDGLADGYEIELDPDRDLDGNGILDCCEFGPACVACISDLTLDLRVDGADVAMLLDLWGATDSAGTGDLDGNGVVNGWDFAVLLGSWGPCP